LGRSSLASFSNYGATMVDVAAPGVGIRSTVPGGIYMQISGTSQATPYVTNIVGQVIDANPKLSLSQVKQIVLQTVDKKDWLAGKVVSGGIANPNRALYAANLSLTMDVYSAIAKAQTLVTDIPPGANEAQMVGKEGTFFVQKLPSFFHN
jgi:subtilisin family serine protease